MKTYFVTEGKNLTVVCSVAHRPETVCKKPHQPPTERLWCGEIKKEDLAQKRVEISDARRRYKRAMAKMHRTISELRVCAPHFKTWADKKIEEAIQGKPKFTLESN